MSSNVSISDTNASPPVWSRYCRVHISWAVVFSKNLRPSKSDNRAFPARAAHTSAETTDLLWISSRQKLSINFQAETVAASQSGSQQQAWSHPLGVRSQEHVAKPTQINYNFELSVFSFLTCLSNIISLTIHSLWQINENFKDKLTVTVS